MSVAGALALAERVACGEWREEDHPRDELGRFAPKGIEPIGVTEDDLPYGAKVPSVSWTERDLQDTGTRVTPETILRDYGDGDTEARVYQRWVPIEDMPTPILAEEENAAPARSRFHQEPLPGEEAEDLDADLDAGDDDSLSYDWSEYSAHNTFPPVKLDVDRNGKLSIIDGNHRTRFFEEAGFDYVPAWVIDHRRATTAKVDASQHGGFFVALWLEPAAARALALNDDDAEGPEELHVTLAYRADVDTLSEETLAWARTLLREVASAHAPLEGVVGGVGRFLPSPGSDGKGVVYAVPDVPRMSGLREAVAAALELAGVPERENHGWNPHITLAYRDDAVLPSVKPVPLRFTALTVKAGDRTDTYPLGGDRIRLATKKAEAIALGSMRTSLCDGCEGTGVVPVWCDDAVLGAVAWSAQPNDQAGVRVVEVMRDDVNGAASAWLRDEVAAFDQDAGVGTAGGLAARIGAEGGVSPALAPPASLVGAPADAAVAVRGEVRTLLARGAEAVLPVGAASLPHDVSRDTVNVEKHGNARVLAWCFATCGSCGGDGIAFKAERCGRGHHGHDGRPGCRGGSKPAEARSDFRRALSIGRRAHRRRVATGKADEYMARDQDLVANAVRPLRQAWPEDELVDVVMRLRAASSPVTRVIREAWLEAFEAARPRVIAALERAAARATAHRAGPAVGELTALAEAWLDRYGPTMFDRRFERLVEQADDDAQVVAIVSGMPAAFEQVLQPLVRRLLSFGAIAQAAEVAKGGWLMRQVAWKYPKDQPLRLPPKDQSLGQMRYAIVLADDEAGSKTGKPVCAVCAYLADVGTFRLADAVQQLDAFLEEAGDGFGERGVDELSPFPRIGEIDGLGVRELTALGIMLPPFHGECRCGIALV